MVNNKNQPCLIFAGVLYCPKVQASLEYLTLLPYPEPQPHLLLFLSLVSQSERPLPSAIALYSLSAFLLGRGGAFPHPEAGSACACPYPSLPQDGQAFWSPAWVLLPCCSLLWLPAVLKQRSSGHRPELMERGQEPQGLCLYGKAPSPFSVAGSQKQHADCTVCELATLRGLPDAWTCPEAGLRAGRQPGCSHGSNLSSGAN